MMPIQESPENIAIPTQIRLETSTACQLKCPTCPTASGKIAKYLGSAYLTFEKFKLFVDSNPEVSRIELSNWGEIFLNKDIIAILRYGYERKIALTAGNGVNLNTVRAGVLEAVVKYKLQFMTCSIDGASQETYATYRVKGNWNTVIRNIREINKWKKHYHSPFPLLTWQYVPFSHNEHEISEARSLAKKLAMEFHVKLSWGDLYGENFSPIHDRNLIGEESHLGVADREEYRNKYDREYVGSDICLGMWKSPQINYDGKLLGCAINFREDYGNVFKDGLKACLNSEKSIYARQMLMGKKQARSDIPCKRCPIYKNMQKNKQWITEEELLSKNSDHSPHCIQTMDKKLIASKGYEMPVCEIADSEAPWKPHILFRGEAATTKFLQCHQSSLNRDHIPHPPHSHSDEELLIILSGEADLILPGTSTSDETQHLRVKRGDVVYYPSQFRHTLQGVSEEPVNYLMLKWENNGVALDNSLEYQYFQASDMLRNKKITQGFSCRVLFENQTKYLKKLHCHLSTLTSGSGYAAHADDYDIVIITLEGELETIGGCFGPNSVIYYAKGDAHGMYNPTLIDAKYIVFEFHGD